MPSDDNTSAPPVSSTSNEQSTYMNSPSPQTSSFFRNRFSNGSLLSLSSLRTLLPQYSVIDTSPPASPPEGTLSSGPSSWNGPSTTEPPRYSLLHHRQSLLTRRASTTTHVKVENDPQAQGFRYSYPIRLRNPWATLHLHTRDAAPGQSKSLQNQPRVPRIWSCDPVTGAVQLDLDSPQSIQRITITLNGSIVLSSHSEGSITFLKREFTVWDKSMDDALHSDTADRIGKKNIDTRLAAGRHMFPFSFPFPTQTDPVLDATSISPFRPRSVSTSVASPTSDHGSKDTEKPQRRWTRGVPSASNEPSSSKKPLALGTVGSDSMLPQTFMEKDIDPNVAYDISVRIIHGRFQVSSKIRTKFAYFSSSEPLPMPQRRRDAYETGALVPSPMDDPDGWFALPTVKIHGMVKIDDKLIHTRVDCTLYIAQPLSYTRGSVIPCFITIYCDDVELTHLLLSTEIPTVRLLRQVWHPLTEHDAPSASPNAINSDYTTWLQAMLPTDILSLVTHDVGRANWWIPSKDIVQSAHARYLEGEIHLSPDLQPSGGFRSFRVEYAVELLTFQTANFKPEIHPPSPGLPRKSDNVAASKPVEITTLHRQDEPIPTAYSELPTTYHAVKTITN